MKRFWLILLSLGLITAFSTQAFAVDVKFSGEFYVAGMYLDKTDLREDTTAHTGDGPSTAFFYQRLRLRTDFVVSPGLSFITRADIMERVWGGKRNTLTTADTGSVQTGYENENIAFDWAYINYASPIGIFDVGYMNYGATGTVFGNSSTPNARIKYSYTTGPATLNLAYSKVQDKSLTAIENTQTRTDVDNDVYHVEGVYSWTGGKAGLNVNYYRYAATRPHSATAAHDYKKTYALFTPYVIAKIGPVALQAELNYATGKSRKYDSQVNNTILYDPKVEDVVLENVSGWVDATADFKQFYFGGTVAYVSGNDPATAKEEGGTLNGGIDWNPCLIMFNTYDRAYWMGTLNGYNGSSDAGTLTNAWFYQGRVGVRPTASWDIVASVSFAAADQKPRIDTAIHDHHGRHIMGDAYPDRDYGWEADVTATYKITNNLSYMLGAGYLWTGDYYKGGNYDKHAHIIGHNNQKVTITGIPASLLVDNFMLINKLTLTF